ncbi:hypothetical protein SUDANB176_00279 [Streptomyces sp. enrichment culture]|uniref:helix-turn-helix domain-containing protein n=1 Tax=Streptomyces sp. enrichment culture TaxID=1795815 RepID=UPI003F5779A3
MEGEHRGREGAAAGEDTTGHDTADHTTALLVGAVALSPPRFAHLFAEQTGTTSMRALREARPRHAARPAARVAEASGFAGPFHFSRALRRRYGVPPRGYRAADRVTS